MTRFLLLLASLALVACASRPATRTTPTSNPGDLEVALEDAPPPARYVPGDEAMYVAWWRATDEDTYQRLGVLRYDPAADEARLVAPMPRADLRLLVTVEEPRATEPDGFVVLRARCDVTPVHAPASASTTTGLAAASTATPSTAQTIVSCQAES